MLSDAGEVSSAFDVILDCHAWTTDVHEGNLFFIVPVLKKNVAIWYIKSTAPDSTVTPASWLIKVFVFLQCVVLCRKSLIFDDSAKYVVYIFSRKVFRGYIEYQ